MGDEIDAILDRETHALELADALVSALLTLQIERPENGRRWVLAVIQATNTRASIKHAMMQGRDDDGDEE